MCYVVKRDVASESPIGGIVRQYVMSVQAKAVLRGEGEHPWGSQTEN